mgnify:CR=1 FL=1
MKKGLSTMRKYQDRALNSGPKLTLAERARLHSLRHPNDKNEPKVRGIYYRSKRRGKK